MTQNFDVFAKRKGQSAIEYLMTYGWMLLVVAIVGGAIFATVQGQCTASTSGFSAADVRIADFGITSDNGLAMELRNAAADPVTIENITIEGPNGDSATSTGPSDAIEVGSTATATVTATGDGFSNANGCNEFDITIDYSGTLGNDSLIQEATGTLTDSLQLST